VSVIVLDTDVASQIFRRRLQATAARHLLGATPAVTFVTVGELTKWTLVRHWGPERLADLHRFLGGLAVLPYGPQVATTWGQLQARAQLRGRPRPANDTWIAACCITRDLPLSTLNTKDFEDLARYEGLPLLPI
jgi:predicted nucleic acid-binding protein